MTGPRLGTPAGDRAYRSAQAAYDAMEPPEYYEQPDPEPEEKEQVCCTGSCDDCVDCEHREKHDRDEFECRKAWCHTRKTEVLCVEQET